VIPARDQRELGVRNGLGDLAGAPRRDRFVLLAVDDERRRVDLPAEREQVVVRRVRELFSKPDRRRVEVLPRAG